ncbi:MAG: nucleotidyltransferase domain-containing protein [Actinomycetota bacterium]|nr:nucleotidyltransferase domain-containing protein [Actinomycetota bacterium]
MDIFNFTKSKTRKAILELYFNNPEKKYYLRQLERITGFPVSNIRREMLKLEKTGLFEKEKQGNLVYYFLNTDSPIFNDVKNILDKTIGVEHKLKESLNDLKGLTKAFIYGSFADKTYDTLSDIDIVVSGKIDENELIEKIAALEKRLGREINYLIYSDEEFSRVDHINKILDNFKLYVSIKNK